eukprot:CAMPEP_0197533718 /NCGR_PEP_ID=MMETSP1318-20131121/44445_1 /TAXON_ID=552666 /ORGANISM="Partenskyella glossopodia, Strain RCC365" /LENGTH=209 /DNA_ID=CAMNT_0043090703 /DNA_START=97 /DNA_END=723 /DNA_ORIENTATION=-
MSPIEVQAIYAVCPVAMVIFSGIGTVLKDRIGRVQTIVVMKTLGVGLLLLMAILAEGIYTSKYILAPIYVVRTGLMNCTYPLDESILMDFCPKDVRGRWKSLESVVAFGWCGSAVLGGWLGDAHGYSFTFIITALIQGGSVIIICFLLPLVPISEKREVISEDDTKSMPDTTGNNSGNKAESDIQKPLIDPTSADAKDEASVSNVGSIQ